MSNTIRGKNKKNQRIPVDKSKWGAKCNTYDAPPEYYYDMEIKCCDCQTVEIWTAEQQRWWYEEKQADINTRAIRCRKCRAHINALKEEQKRHIDENSK